MSDAAPEASERPTSDRRRGGLLSRRGFLAGMAAAAIVGVGVGRARQGAGEADAAALVDGLGDRDAAAWLGRGYLEARPDEADAAMLVAAVFPDGPPTARAAPGVVSERVAGDYAAGRLVDVEGWLVAEAEARIAALWVVEGG